MFFTMLSTTATVTKTAVFDSSFLITVAIIVISTILIAFINHLKKDKCLKSFKADIVTVFFNNGQNVKGRLDVENTGCELISDLQGNDEKRSYIIYKDEYPNIRFFVRFHKDMDSRRRKDRLRMVKKTYHPNIFRKAARAINIFFKIIRDSLMDIFTAFSGKLKTFNPSYASSETYVTKVNKEAVSSIDTTYNPLLEKYIGNKIVCNHVFNGKPYDIYGILKNYTAEYIELLDCEVQSDDFSLSEADLVLPRTSNRIRNLGEDAVKPFALSEAFNLDIYKREIKKSIFENHKEDEK
ncbi:MAG: hypothetical protein JXN10_04315 [Clostridia bacterium]|nr:hypothetical protein [Clostridia bacterium]